MKQNYLVVICFEFIIFALRITSLQEFYITLECCDLLRIYYFCTTNHIKNRINHRATIVVICFEFIIFALRITSLERKERQKIYVVICFEFIIFALRITSDRMKDVAEDWL